MCSTPEKAIETVILLLIDVQKVYSRCFILYTLLLSLSSSLLPPLLFVPIMENVFNRVKVLNDNTTIAVIIVTVTSLLIAAGAFILTTIVSPHYIRNIHFLQATKKAS